MTVLAALLALAVQAAPAAPAGAWTWSLYDGGGDVALALEIPDTDQLDAVFQCTPKSGKVKLTLYKLAGEGGTAELSSQDVKATAPLSDRKDQLVTELAVTDPVFMALVGSGKLTVKAAGAAVTVTPPTDKLRQLAQRCGG